MKLILFDTEARHHLFPLTLTRAVAGLRVGILTIKERWERVSGLEVLILTEDYLQPLYGSIDQGFECLFIDARVIPNAELVKQILALDFDEAIADCDGIVSGKTVIQNNILIQDVASLFQNIHQLPKVNRLSYLYQLFQWNKEMIEFDFYLLTNGKSSYNIDPSNHIKEASNIFVEEGTDVSHSSLNASTGPIYIGKNVTIMEGTTVRGPFAICEGSVLKMGTKVYGATTIGPFSMAGGEIKNSIITGYSNKAHEGYLGDSVLGEWCNLGAGTSNSNLKNTGGTVALYDYPSETFIPAGNKCGVVMGDYSRTAINSSINTGSVIGVCCNVFGEGLLPKFIPDFTWGTIGLNRYDFTKAIKDIGNWKNMKNKTISDRETQVLEHIFELSGKKEF